MKYPMDKYATNPLEKSAKKYKEGQFYKEQESKVVKNIGSKAQLEAEIDASSLGKEIGMTPSQAMKTMKLMAKKIKLGRKFQKKAKSQKPQY